MDKLKWPFDYCYGCPYLRLVRESINENIGETHINSAERIKQYIDLMREELKSIHKKVYICTNTYSGRVKLTNDNVFKKSPYWCRAKEEE